jgi:hypothetical protein
MPIGIGRSSFHATPQAIKSYCFLINGDGPAGVGVQHLLHSIRVLESDKAKPSKGKEKGEIVTTFSSPAQTGR